MRSTQIGNHGSHGRSVTLHCSPSFSDRLNDREKFNHATGYVTSEENESKYGMTISENHMMMASATTTTIDGRDCVVTDVIDDWEDRPSLEDVVCLR